MTGAATPHVSLSELFGLWLTFGDKRLESSETTRTSSWIAEDASERPYKVSVINSSLLQLLLLNSFTKSEPEPLFGVIFQSYLA
jgi:hypothetical protein